MNMQNTSTLQAFALTTAQIVFMSFFVPAVAHALPAGKPCSILDEREAEEIAGKLATWGAVHDAYLKFAHCDDGSIGEGFSESITMLFAGQWWQFEEFNRLANRDKQFEAFVLRHIDATVPFERLDIIFKNASRQCKDGELLCKKIAKSAASAKREGQTPR